jgi:hypothetical protein
MLQAEVAPHDVQDGNRLPNFGEWQPRPELRLSNAKRVCSFQTGIHDVYSCFVVADNIPELSEIPCKRLQHLLCLQLCLDLSNRPDTDNRLCDVRPQALFAGRGTTITF